MLCLQTKNHVIVNVQRRSGSCYLFHIKVHASRHAVAVKLVVTRNLTLLRNMFLRGFKIFPTHGRCIDACSINTKLSTKSKLVIYDLNSIIILMCMILDISGRILLWKIGLDIFLNLCCFSDQNTRLIIISHLFVIHAFQPSQHAPNPKQIYPCFLVAPQTFHRTRFCNLFANHVFQPFLYDPNPEPTANMIINIVRKMNYI